MKPRQLILWGTALGGLLLPSLEARPWTEAASGRSVEGEFVRQEGNTVLVRRPDGAVLKLPLDRLTDADREFVGTQAPTQAAAPVAPLKPTHKKGEPIQVGDVLAISFRSVSGEKVDLATLGDKLVLLDFWATWCGPCIGELPNVKQAYQTYHAKGFEIVAISLDSDKGTLKDFIKENEMPWAQYFDGKGWENDLAQEFGVNSIPAAFLVQNGKVLAEAERGPALLAQIEELLK